MQLRENFNVSAVAIATALGEIPMATGVTQLAMLAAAAGANYTLVSDAAAGLRWQLQPACHLLESNTINMVTGAAFNTITFDTVTRDDGVMYAGAQPSRLTAPVAGWYIFHGNGNATRGAGTVTWHLQIILSTGTVIALNSKSSSADARINLGMAYYLTAGQYAELEYQTTDPGSVIAANTTFAATWIRP